MLSSGPLKEIKKLTKEWLPQLNEEILDWVQRRPPGIRNRVLNLMLNKKIPFNAPHNYQVLQMEKGKAECEVLLPYQKSNWNHLKGIHAGAMATGTEFVAGLSLIALLGMNRYRLILARLECRYVYQGREDVLCRAEIPEEAKVKLLRDLNETGLTHITIQTRITNQSGQLVAEGLSEWQIKDWNLVKTPV